LTFDFYCFKFEVYSNLKKKPKPIMKFSKLFFLLFFVLISFVSYSQQIKQEINNVDSIKVLNKVAPINKNNPIKLTPIENYNRQLENCYLLRETAITNKEPVDKIDSDIFQLKNKIMFEVEKDKVESPNITRKQ
jgi:hypothetical protein